MYIKNKSRHVRALGGGTMQWYLHETFLLFADLWTLLIKISKCVTLTA